MGAWKPQPTQPRRWAVLTVTSLRRTPNLETPKRPHPRLPKAHQYRRSSFNGTALPVKIFWRLKHCCETAGSQVGSVMTLASFACRLTADTRNSRDFRWWFVNQHIACNCCWHYASYLQGVAHSRKKSGCSTCSAARAFTELHSSDAARCRQIVLRRQKLIGVTTST
jgi:hypothetical protein